MSTIERVKSAERTGPATDLPLVEGQRWIARPSTNYTNRCRRG